LSGIEIYHRKYIVNRKAGLGTASLDRKDSSKGYTKDNIQWIHKDLQKMKMDMPEDKFINWCNLIIENRKKNNVKLFECCL
jgi:peroxiredoxin family protein